MIDGSLTKNQIAALAMLIEDIGLATYRQSKLFWHLRRGEIEDAADEFMTWVYSEGEESKKLREHRAGQQRLFLLEAF